MADRLPIPRSCRDLGLLVAEVSGTATVGKDVVEFDAEVTIEVLKEGWL